MHPSRLLCKRDPSVYDIIIFIIHWFTPVRNVNWKLLHLIYLKFAKWLTPAPQQIQIKILIKLKINYNSDVRMYVCVCMYINV